MTLAATPSTWTKGDIVAQSFAELGLAAYVFDLTADQKADALRKLTAMMRGWAVKKVDVPYAYPSAPDGDGWQQASQIPDSAVEAVYSNLALRLAPSYGKAPSADTRRAAASGYTILQAVTAVMPVQQLPSTLPIGAGNKFWTDANYYPVADGEA